MMTKRKAVLIAAACAALGLMAGCSSDSAKTTAAVQEQTTAEAESAAETEESSGEETAAEDTEGEGKTLVVYFSATGNTENVANYIADVTGGDLFELEPVEPYTDEELNYNDENSRVSQEHADESLRDVELVSTTVDGFEDYDTVFIGYPNLWGTMPMSMFTFLERCDLSGKRIFPFCTNEGSGMGGSERDLKRIYKGAVVEKGLTIHGAEAADSRSKVETWVKKQM